MINQHKLRTLGLISAMVVQAASGAGPKTAPTTNPDWPATPTQDRGLPYTRSARSTAIGKLGRSVAVFAGSRYGYVNGLKVRLDDAQLRGGEAVLDGGQIFVPVAFAGLVGLESLDADTAVDGLDDRWVYTVKRPAYDANNARTLSVAGKPYVSLADIAAARGLKFWQDPRGLGVVSRDAFSPGDDSGVMLDAIITLFDTPERFADPTIAERYLPALIRQGPLRSHVKITPEQQRILEGPETVWPTAPASSFDFQGFDASRLGSPLPPPGVFPRVLFSPQDVPVIAERIRASRVGQMSLTTIDFLLKRSWWDPTTSDGGVFVKLASGDTAGMVFDNQPTTPPNSVPGVFKDQKPGIHNSHVQYVPECLTTMALYCLLTDDEVHGRQAAAAIVNYYKLREPLLDEANAISDSEYSGDYTRPDGTVVPMHGGGAQTHWRTVAGVLAHMNVGLSLDFAGRWMTPSEIETMRRIIAKGTYGRRAYGQDGPVRFRDVNWVAWDLPQFLALCAIEGLQGFDPEAYDANAQTVRAFCDWGIDDHGVIYESNGKTAGGLQFQQLSMVALARRGDNLFGHPHWRKLLQGQVQMTSPSGNVVVNSGTQYNPFSQAWLSPQFINEYKAFYPGERTADYLLTRERMRGVSDDSSRNWIFDNFDPATYLAALPKLPRVRMPSPTYPGFVHGLLYDADYEPTARADLKLPLDFNDPTNGVFSAYSDASPDAAWLNMLVRPNHYLGAGHHHADAGMIHFSASGVDWLTQSPFPQEYGGQYYNLVQVDGRSEPQSMAGFALGYPAAAKYLGATSSAGGGFASADLTDSYTYRWLTQPGQYWPDDVRAMDWELDPSPKNLAMFAGTWRYKMRPWWAYYTYSNAVATSRAKYNPMEYVFRTAGLVRGTHAYAVVADDLKKDAQPHDYQWFGMLSGGVWRAEVSGLKPGQVALAYQPVKSPVGAPLFAPDYTTPDRPAIAVRDGNPILLVCALATDPAAAPQARISTEPGPRDPKSGNPKAHDRLTLTQRGDKAALRVLLIPARAGQPLPVIGSDTTTGTWTVEWPDQSDQITFQTTAGSPTRITIRRDGKEIVGAK